MVSIIIVSYNTRSLLKSCLQSIQKYFQGVDLEVIVIDNASEDKSLFMVKEQFKKVRSIENRENVGFAKANNIAAKFAKGDYLLFLNSDAEMQDTSAKHLTAVLDENEHVGIVGGYLETGMGSTSKSYGKFFTLMNVFRLLFFENKKNVVGFLSHNPKKVDWVSGGFMMIRNNLFKKLNGFDSNFFMYIEDMEICYRAKKLGYDTFFDPNAKVMHIGQGSSSRSFAILHIYKGILYFYKKHKNNVEYKIIQVLLVAKALIAITVGVITQNRFLKSTYKQALLLAI